MMLRGASLLFRGGTGDLIEALSRACSMASTPDCDPANSASAAVARLKLPLWRRSGGGAFVAGAGGRDGGMAASGGAVMLWLVGPCFDVM